MTIKEFFSFKTNKYFWVNILVMIVAVVLIVFGVMNGWMFILVTVRRWLCPM